MMNFIEKKIAFNSTSITTRSFPQTIGSYKYNELSMLSNDYLGYLVQTHCQHISKEKMISSIDFIKVVFPIENIKALNEINKWVKEWLRQVGISISTKKAVLKHHSNGVKLFPLDATNDVCGSIKWDLAKRSYQLELTGDGCRYVQTHFNGFYTLYSMLCQYVGKVTLIEIAVDDFTGKYDTRYVQKCYSNGDYNPTRGKRPLKNPLGKNFPGSEYIGSEGSAKCLNVYRKWQQLKLKPNHPRYKKWTRHEVTLQRKNNHIIGSDVLLNPDGYFVGAYPKVHKRLINNVKPRSPIREKSLEITNTLSRSVAHCKYQHGRVINQCRELMGDDSKLLALLMREGAPKKSTLPSYVNERELIENCVSDNGKPFPHYFEMLVEGHNPLNQGRS
jgi:DNA relaxase NicK